MRPIRCSSTFSQWTNYLTYIHPRERLFTGDSSIGRQSTISPVDISTPMSNGSSTPEEGSRTPAGSPVPVAGEVEVAPPPPPIYSVPTPSAPPVSVSPASLDSGTISPSHTKSPTLSLGSPSSENAPYKLPPPKPQRSSTLTRTRSRSPEVGSFSPAEKNQKERVYLGYF